MKLSFIVSAVAIIAGAACPCIISSAQAQGVAPRMSFFITSQGPGDGANLGGLAGADRHCAMLAEGAGVTGKTWRAYLSTTGAGTVNARDRIGNGPWVNARGVTVAENIEHLHSDDNKLSKENSLSERGEVINGRGDTPNRHDILTGSSTEGRAVVMVDGSDTTCRNWTYDGPDGSALVGHHDRQGGGINPTSWNDAHPSRGCSQANLRSTGGDGLFYCFATD